MFFFSSSSLIINNMKGTLLNNVVVITNINEFLEKVSYVEMGFFEQILSEIPF